MTCFTIFYSWQSDRDTRCCKDFVRLAADAAVARLSKRLGVEIRVDADTEGVSGTPPISATILRKIDECDLFLADVTFVARTNDEKPLPNPNVMGEYGYALRAKGYERILLVMNALFGPPEALPFDLHHLRHPAQYTLEEGAPDGLRRKTRDRFSELLEHHISAAIEALMKAPATLPSASRWEDAEAALLTFSASRQVFGPVLVSPPKLIVWVIPLAALNEPSISAFDVKAARPLFPPSMDTRVFDDQDENQWWSSDPPRPVSGKPNPEASWLFRFSRPGFFEVIATVGVRVEDDPTIVVQGHEIERFLVSAVDRAAKVAEQLGLKGPALIAGGLESIEGLEIHRSRPGAGGRRIRRPMAALRTVRLANLEAPAADRLGEVMESMWLIGGWDTGSSYFANGRWTGYGSN